MSEGKFLHALVGSMSQGAAGNPTVAMVEAAFRHHGLHWRYINLEVHPAALAAAVQGARAMGFRGFNVSMPHKVSIVPMLAGLGASAAVIGAVNCVVLRDGKWIGENTDGKGFLTSLQSIMDPRGKKMVIFGAGGAARAVAVELALAGTAQITIVNRSAARGQELVATLSAKTPVTAEFAPWSGDFSIPPGTDAVINATSIGLYDGEATLALDLPSLQPGMLVADVVFSPPRTRFLRDAAARGCVTLDGLGMLVNQGVIGVEYWTSLRPDAAVMRRALEEALGV